MDKCLLFYQYILTNLKKKIRLTVQFFFGTAESTASPEERRTRQRRQPPMSHPASLCRQHLLRKRTKIECLFAGTPPETNRPRFGTSHWKCSEFERPATKARISERRDARDWGLARRRVDWVDREPQRWNAGVLRSR